jgi:hypothetical protein
MKFASDTNVSVERSKAEIEATIMKYGATGLLTGWHGNHAMVQFEMKTRQLRFMLPLPDKADKRFWYTPARRNKRDEHGAYLEWEQACRQRWRALLLAIKAKLEAVECGISEFEQEFMANIVLPDGFTIGERILPGLPEVFRGGKMPPLLPSLPPVQAQAGV